MYQLPIINTTKQLAKIVYIPLFPIVHHIEARFTNLSARPKLTGRSPNAAALEVEVEALVPSSAIQITIPFAFTNSRACNTPNIPIETPKILPTWVNHNTSSTPRCHSRNQSSVSPHQQPTRPPRRTLWRLSKMRFARTRWRPSTPTYHIPRPAS